MQNLIPLPGITILCNEQLQKRIRPAAEALELKVVAPDRVLIVGEALDAEQLPGRKRVEQEAFLGALPPRPHLERLGGLAAEREGQDGAALGDVDVVVEALVRRALLVQLPGGRVEPRAEEGVVFKDEEEGSLAEVGEGHGRRDAVGGHRRGGRVGLG
jgi:hypothetical protein